MPPLPVTINAPLLVSPSMEEASSSSGGAQQSASPANQEQQPQQRPQQSVSYRIRISVNDNNAGSTDDALSCLVVLITFFFFVSMTLILGIYGSSELAVGPNCSRLIQTNSMFVQDIKVKIEEGSKEGPMLYGFLTPPPLDVPVSWSETHNVSISPSFHKEWVYYLNGGAQMNISYSVKSDDESYPLNLVIAQGKEELVGWAENPSQPDIPLSWNLICGNGVINQKIDKSSNYFLAVGNFNDLELEIQLEIRIQTLLYNTTGAYYKCSLDHGQCTFKLFALSPNVAILSTGLSKAGNYDQWYIKLSYGPRWITYFVGSCILIIIILFIYKILNNLLCNHDGSTNNQTTNNNNQRSPLLTNNKEEDNSSLGSSYESVSHDEQEDMEEEWLKIEATKSLEESGSRHLCAICCDNQRDCFFLPCGHSATCYTCGVRISDEAGTCPICRRRMKKVRRIFAV